MKVADPATQPASVQKRKTQNGTMDARSGGRSSRRWAQTLSSVAAVLVVALIISGAFVLFSHKPGSRSTGVGSTSASTVLYTYTYLGTQKKASLDAIDATNGLVIWKATPPVKLIMDGSLEPYQGLLFAPGDDGNLYALSATNGAVVWKYAVKYTSTTPASVIKLPTSIIANGNTVYFAADNSFYAVDLHTGKLLWHVVKLPLVPCASPKVIQQKGSTSIVSDSTTCEYVLGTVSNGRVYAYSEGLYVLDVQTGKELWHDKRFQDAGPASMAVVDDNVYAYSEKQSALFILNASDGSEKTEIAGASRWVIGDILAGDGIVYYNNGHEVLALHGTQILWTKKYQTWGLLAESKGTLFMSSMQPLEGSQQIKGERGTYFYALDTKTGAIKWHWGEKGDNLAVPLYPLSFDGKLYFFSSMQQGNKWIDIPVLYVLHDSQRDMYPLKES